ncbi:hypothetical protein ACOMHN_015083 [Nucella lapillus]
MTSNTCLSKHCTGSFLWPVCDYWYHEVEENTALTLTCDGYSGIATWVYKPVTGNTSQIGSCHSTCTVTIPVFTLTANSATSSSLHGLLGIPHILGHNFSVWPIMSLRNVDCTLLPTTPVINRQDSGYTLPVSAAVTRVYSSRGLYSCAVQLGSSSQPGTLDLSPTASDTSNTADSCPSDFIPENTLLTCTCNTNNIGKPGGRLRWYTGTGSDFSTEVVSANHDITTLEMTWTVKRGDHGRKFRCINNWTVKVNAGSDYTASVAWGPDTVSIDGNTLVYTDTAVSKVMTLTCQVNGVNPSSALTYNWNVLCDDKQQSTCTFRPRPGPNGDDNTVITCTVTNSKNNNKQRQKSGTLDIKCPVYENTEVEKKSEYVNVRKNP